MKSIKNPNLSATPRAGFLRSTADYWWGAYAQVVETRYDVSTPKLAINQTLTVAIVTDIHADTRFMPLSRIEQIVERTNALGADVIYIGGDLSAQCNALMTPLPLQDTVAVLAQLKAPSGVFAVLGNHDWWDDAQAQAANMGPPETVALCHGAGIPVLQNDAVQLDHPSGVWLAGLDSQQAFRRPMRAHIGAHDLGKALAKVPPNAPCVLLAHEPDIFAELPMHTEAKPIDLVLSGHTHGGQISLFGMRPIVSSKFGAGYAYGHVQEEGRDLIVSGGLGCSNIPVRMGVLPEIVLVTIRGQASRVEGRGQG